MLETEITQIVDGGAAGGDRLNELVDEFRRGRDIMDVAPLLDSQRAEVVSIGAWILGELHLATYNSDELIGRLRKLLEHPDGGVRFHALSAIFPALDPNATSTRTLLKTLCSDPNEGVRTSAEAAAARIASLACGN